MATRKQTTHIIIHCSATPPSMDIGAREIDKWHRQRGFLKIGYHFVIRRSGEIEFGRKVDEPGAHCKYQNGTSVGICLVGGVKEDKKTPEENFTEDQWWALKKVISDLRRRYPHAQIAGHNEFDKGKACPSFNVQTHPLLKEFQ